MKGADLSSQTWQEGSKLVIFAWQWFLVDFQFPWKFEVLSARPCHKSGFRQQSSQKISTLEHLQFKHVDLQQVHEFVQVLTGDCSLLDTPKLLLQRVNRNNLLDVKLVNGFVGITPPRRVVNWAIKSSSLRFVSILHSDIRIMHHLVVVVARKGHLWKSSTPHRTAFSPRFLGMLARLLEGACVCDELMCPHYLISHKVGSPMTHSASYTFLEPSPTVTLSLRRLFLKWRVVTKGRAHCCMFVIPSILLCLVN